MLASNVAISESGANFRKVSSSRNGVESSIVRA
jgi:hypothetical protein